MADITKQATANTPQPVIEMPKHWWQSKVIWFNYFAIMVGLISSATPALESHLSPESYGLLTAIVALINAILRFSTKSPITTRGNQDSNDIAAETIDDSTSNNLPNSGIEVGDCGQKVTKGLLNHLCEDE